MRTGFVLLDALVAFALAAFAVTVILTVLPGSATRPAERLDRLLATEFAYSLLEEYRVTHPAMANEGTLPNGWAWRITERALPDLSAAGHSDPIQLFEVTANTWHEDQADLRATLMTVIARRRE